MYEITILQNSKPILKAQTDTYVLAYVNQDIYDPTTQRQGNAAIASFLSMCLFGETLDLIQRVGMAPPDSVDAATEDVNPARAEAPIP
jgi:hypothetical protein